MIIAKFRILLLQEMAAPNATVETTIKHAASTVGEGPHWEEKTGKLLYVDIYNRKVNRFHIETQVNEQINLGEYAVILEDIIDFLAGYAGLFDVLWNALWT